MKVTTFLLSVSALLLVNAQTNIQLTDVPNTELASPTPYVSMEFFVQDDVYGSDKRLGRYLMHRQ